MEQVTAPHLKSWRAANARWKAGSGPSVKTQCDENAFVIH